MNTARSIQNSHIVYKVGENEVGSTSIANPNGTLIVQLVTGRHTNDSVFGLGYQSPNGNKIAPYTLYRETNL